MQFQAKAKLLEKLGDSWESKSVVISSVDDIRNYFKPYQSEVTQVNVSLHEKVYYCSYLIKPTGIEATIIDEITGEKFYMCSPLLLVQCDNIKPIDITEDCYENIKARIDFY